MSRLRRILAVCFALALIPSALEAQNRGTIAGLIVDEATQRPLQGAQVMIAGTSLGTLANAQGRFLIPNVPVGTQQVRASLIGYGVQTQQVTVSAGETATANFSLSPSAVQLGEVIVTATGQQQARREIGNAVSTIAVEEEVEMAAVNDIAQVLQGRSAGVSVVQAGGTVGGGSRIRIRGSNSISLSNEPLLVIDGVRSESGMGNSIGVGGQTPSRLSDINPEDIESIDVLKGPAASALYGTAASNGVIVVTTRRGRSGEVRWRAYTEQGWNEDVVNYPANFVGTDPGNPFGLDDFCLTVYQARGLCELQAIESFNPLMDPETTPFETGRNQKYGLNVSGGSEGTTYFLSGDFEENDGIYRFNANSLERINLRANLRTALRENMNLSVSSGFLTSDLRLPQNDNNVLGLISGGLLGWPSRDQGTDGYLYVDPVQSSAINTRQNTQRFTGGVNLDYQPLTWLSVIGTAGMDLVDRHDNELIPPERVFFSSYPEGERTSNRIRIGNYTATLGGTANYPFSETIRGSSSLGMQYNEEIFRGTFAYGAQLLAGSGSLEGTNARFAVGESNNQVRTIGGYFQQQLTFAERLYLTGALRADDNSTFGEDFSLVYYPSLSASWVVSEEPFFPQLDALSSLRLRAAYGRAGRQPGSLDAVRFFSPVAVTVEGASVPGFTIGGAGNPDLKPESSSEIEVGFDTGLFSDQVSLEFTYFNKNTTDLLIARRLAPSLGVSTTRFDNLGRVRNDGFEALLNADVIRRPDLRWNVTLAGSRTENELVSIGIDPTTGEPIREIIFGLGGNTQRHQEGFPLGAYFQETYTFADVDGDGLIDNTNPEEFSMSGEQEYLGQPFPTRQLSLNTNVTFRSLIRLAAQLEHQGGHRLFNSTREFRCGAFFVCEDVYDPSTPLDAQAAWIASAFHGSAAGYIEKADFTKLREVALTFLVPERYVNRFGAGEMSLTLAGRNLATWTDYTGFDPEMNFAGSGSNFTTAEFLTQPPYRTYTVRLDVTF